MRNQRVWLGVHDSVRRSRDAGPGAVDGVARERLGVGRRPTQLAIDRQPGDAVHDRPDERRELQRIVAAHEPGLLLRNQGIDEDLKRRRAPPRRAPDRWRGR